MKATRILYCKKLNRDKYQQLVKQALLLGKVRSEVWQKYGPISGIHLRDRQIRDLWLDSGRKFGVSSTAWKETLRDAIADIKAYREAAKEKVKVAIRTRSADKDLQKKMYVSLKGETWHEDSFLRRQMRKHFKHGVNRTQDQIVVRSDNYSVFEKNGKCWLKILGLEKGKRITIPLNTKVEFAPTGTLRLILKGGTVEVHYVYQVEKTNDCGAAEIGVDKGYSEVFVDSDGQVYGDGLGKLISKESDFLNKKYTNRNKLGSVAKKNPKKKAAIIKNNLGRIKLDKRQQIQQNKLKTKIHTATNQLVDKAASIVCEDLTQVFSRKKHYGKNTNRRLNTWTKRFIADALEMVSQRRGSSLHIINAAYTSQMDSFNHGLFTGTRKGDKFYRDNGDVVQADYNAARNVLARKGDTEIGRYTSFKKVKDILQKRTNRYRLELTNQGFSCTLGNKASTKCESIHEHI